MAEGLTGIINQLEQQKAAIERALAALREIEDIAAPSTAAEIRTAATPEASSRKRKKFSTAARRKMGLAQKARWAKIKGEVEPPPPPAPEPPKPKRRISAEGMKRIIAATKKRWRLQKAAAKSAPAKPAKKVAPKKVVGKKAVVKAPSAKAGKKVTPGRKTVAKKSAQAPTPDLAQPAG